MPVVEPTLAAAALGEAAVSRAVVISSAAATSLAPDKPAASGAAETAGSVIREPLDPSPRRAIAEPAADGKVSAMLGLPQARDLIQRRAAAQRNPVFAPARRMAAAVDSVRLRLIHHRSIAAGRVDFPVHRPIVPALRSAAASDRLPPMAVVPRPAALAVERVALAAVASQAIARVAAASMAVAADSIRAVVAVPTVAAVAVSTVAAVVTAAAAMADTANW